MKIISGKNGKDILLCYFWETPLDPWGQKQVERNHCKGAGKIESMILFAGADGQKLIFPHSELDGPVPDLVSKVV